MTVDELERKLSEASRRMRLDADLESLLDRVELEVGPRTRRSLWSKLAVAAIALAVASAGGVLVLRAFRNEIPAASTPPPGGFHAIWPEHDYASALEAQRRADAGSDSWRLDSGATAIAFSATVLGVPDSTASKCDLTRNGACPLVSDDGDQHTVFLYDRSGRPILSMHLARLVSAGRGGVWSVVSVNSGGAALGSFELPTGIEGGPANELGPGGTVPRRQDILLRSALDANAPVAAAYALWGPCGAQTGGSRAVRDGAFWRFSGPADVDLSCHPKMVTTRARWPGMLLVAQGREHRPNAHRLVVEQFAQGVWTGVVMDDDLAGIVAIPVVFDFEAERIVGPGSTSFLGRCPFLQDTLPVGPEWANEAEAFVDAQDPEWGVLGSGPGWDSDFATTECGEDVARRTWIVTTYPLAQPDSASLPIDLYLVRRAGGWEVWGSY